jgi:SOS-response transcriptional repressor LexA
MKRQAPKLEIKFVPHLGQVGCGRAVEALDNVYPFIPRDELIAVALPSHIPASQSGVFEISGLSLSDFGLFEGDELLVTKAFDKRDIDENTICVVYIHSTGELVAKRIERGANTVTLRASGGGFADKEYAIDEIEIRYIVLKAIIDMDTLITRSREAKRRSEAIGRRKANENAPKLWTEPRYNDDMDIPY